MVPRLLVKRRLSRRRLLSFSTRAANVSRCCRQRATAPPSPVIRIAWKMASHSFSIASSPGQSGNTFDAQEGIGMEATHQGTALLICKFRYSCRAAPALRCARTSLSGSTPSRFSGFVAEIFRKAAPSLAYPLWKAACQSGSASNTSSLAWRKRSLVSSSSPHFIMTSRQPAA